MSRDMAIYFSTTCILGTRVRKFQASILAQLHCLQFHNLTFYCFDHDHIPIYIYLYHRSKHRFMHLQMHIYLCIYIVIWVEFLILYMFHKEYSQDTAIGLLIPFIIIARNAIL